MRPAALSDELESPELKGRLHNYVLLNEETPEPRTQTGTGGEDSLGGPVPHERLKAA